MSESSASHKIDIWPKDWITYLIETAFIALLNIVAVALQEARLDLSLVLSSQLGLRIFGSLCLWFANKYVLERLLQARIDSNKITQYLPFELTIASVTVTTVFYLIFYPIFIYLNYLSFDLAKFMQGLFATCGLSLLIVVFYAGNQMWQSWWSDGEFLFNPKATFQPEGDAPEYIVIKNTKGTVKQDLNEVLYFISESKIAFLVDVSGKKWITQYNLSELEDMLGVRFFRLNRQILVCHQAIIEVKKLPNHRLLVTLGISDGSRVETISRYKSTRFKQWYYNQPHE